MAKLDVFDCQEMPKDVKKYFFDHYGEGKSNDVYIDVYIEGDVDGDLCDSNDLCDSECDQCSLRTFNIVEQWLIEQGIKNECIVKRWW